MSIGYAISATLNAKSSIKNIEHILQNASKHGFALWKHEFDLLAEELSTKIDSTTAALQIYEAMKAKKKGVEDAFAGIVTKYVDTYCYLLFYNTEAGLIVNLSLIAYVEKRDFYDGPSGPDFAHYIKFLLMACEDFYILKIETEAS